MDLIVKNSQFAGVGLPIFRPEGAWMKNKLRELIRCKLLVAGYQEVESPAVGALSLFETSGHYPYYKNSMFNPIEEYDGTMEHFMEPVASWALKPMNCPFHIGVYKDEPRSYKDLPVRYFEFGKVYRMEDSGSVNGLLRSRAFEQDDGHIFCTDDQIGSEVRKTIFIANQVFAEFGLEPVARLSVRGEDIEKYIGGDSLWIHAINELRIALEDTNIDYVTQEGAAFYGPKIDFIVKDKLDREWQLGTIQLDFNLPKQFELEYKNAQNGMSTPVMIHRALLGSLERFIGYLMSEDKIPDFIHPKLYALVPVGSSMDEETYSRAMSEYLFQKGKSNKVFMKDEPLKARIKRAKEEGYRYVAVFGPKELATSSFCADVYNVRIDNKPFLL